MSYITRVRLCVDTAQPVDPGNYDGPTHCLGRPGGHDCITAMFDIDRSTLTFESQRSPYTGLHVNAGPLPGEAPPVADRCGCGHRMSEHGGSGCAADDEAAMGGCDCPVKGEPRKRPAPRPTLGPGGTHEIASA